MYACNILTQIQRVNLFYWEVIIQLQSWVLSMVLNAIKLTGFVFSLSNLHYWDCFFSWGIATAKGKYNPSESVIRPVTHPHLFPSPPIAHPFTDLSLLHSFNHSCIY